MAFSSSSFFVGVGTVVAAIAVGFAGGAMITTSTVQPQNRLERVTTAAAPPPTASSSKAPEQANVTAPPAQQPQVPATAPSAQVVATAPSAPVADSQPVQPPSPAAAKVDTKTDTAVNAQQPPPSLPQTARSEDAAPAKNQRAGTRSTEADKEASRSADSNRADSNRDASRKRADERKFTERKRRQELDEVTDVVRQMPRDRAVNVVEREDAPRVIDGPPRRFGLFGNDEDSPRVVNEPPPRFGLFGN